MANAFYPKALEAFAQGDLSWKSSGGDTFKAVLIDTADYTYSSAHDYLDDVASAARVSTATLTTLAPTNGVLDASDVTFTAPSGDTCEALIIYQWTGVESTSLLVLYIDTASAGLPVTPDGSSDITVAWSSSGIASL